MLGGHKVTSEGHCLSPSAPGPWLEAALQGLESEQRLNLEPYLGQALKEVKDSRTHPWAPCLAWQREKG